MIGVAHVVEEECLWLTRVGWMMVTLVLAMKEKMVQDSVKVVEIQENETIEFFESWKYGPPIMAKQFQSAGMALIIATWTVPLGNFRKLYPLLKFCVLWDTANFLGRRLPRLLCRQC